MPSPRKTNLNICVVCKIQKEKKTEWRLIDSSHGQKKRIAQLLLKYGEIDVVDGAICRPCERKLSSLDNSVREFKFKCNQNFHLISPKRCFTDENTNPAKKLSNNGENVENPTPSSPKSTHMSTSSNISTPQNFNTVRKQLGDISNITCTPIRPKHHDTLNDSGISLSTPEIEIETNSLALNRKNKSNSTVTCSKELFKDTPINVECHDHIYSAVSTPRKRSKIKTTKETLPKEEETLAVKSLKKIIVKQQQYDNLSPVELAEIVSVLPLGSRSALIQTLLKYDSFKHLITDELMKILSNQHDILKNRKKGKLSVLNGKSFEDMINFNWSPIVEELCDEFPVLCRTILSFMLPDNLTEKTKSDRITSMVPRIGFIYSLLVQSRNQELSKVQHMINTILFDNLCDQKVFDRLHSIGACMSYGHSLTILDKYGGHFNSAVIDALKSGKRIRLVGDNINWMTNVHDERKDNHAHMHHAFGSACIIQNTSFDLLSSIKPQLDYRYASVETFLPSRNDWHLLREDYSVHILKVASKHIPFFKEFCKPFENFFHGTLTEELKTKNKVIPLPVLHYNEQKYDEVVKILDFYESFLRESFGKANIDYNDTVKVLIGGDQLTRERFSGSKCLRAGGITADERFDHLSPITFELFHLCMNYVKLIMKQLFKDQSVNEMGTMKCEANRLLRTTVNVNVNEHYDADKDFIISFTDAYITEAVMTFFEMENPTSAPTINRHEPPSQFTNDSEKKEWILSIFGDLVDKMVWCNEGDTSRSNSEEEVHEDGEVLRLKLANGNFKSFVIKKKKTPPKEDKVQSYGHLVLELGVHFKALLSLCKTPDRERGLRLLKVTMLHFKANNWMSKYAYEIMRLLVHQYCILSEQEASEEFYALFVNTKGKTDSHIPCDLQMEYIVKCVKKHLKHMFSNKTDDFISKRTSAISAISDISEQFDRVSNVVIRSKRHSDLSSIHDELDMISDLRQLRPFETDPGRQHDTFPGISRKMENQLDMNLFRNWILQQKIKFATELGK